MKNETSLFLLSLTLVLTVLLSACGQSQTNVPPSKNDSAANTPAADTNVPVNEPEDSQTADTPAGTDAPTGSDTPTEEPETDSATENKEPSDTAEDTPETNVPAPEESVPAPEPEPAQTTEPAPAPEQDTTSEPELAPQEPSPIPEPVPEPESEPEPVETPASNTALSGTTLTLRFGGGESFTINMYDNDTANKIAEYVGTASWNLPIYHFDDYDGWESFQYYDIPSRYDIPDGSESVTSEKAGAVYYSHPNRIILFYQDAEISTEYTPVGYIDFSQDLVDAVENNPVVQGWGNKLVFIQP